MPSTGQGTRLKLVVYKGSLKQRFEKWGRAIGPEPRAQLGLGTSMPYIKCLQNDILSSDTTIVMPQNHKQ